MPIFSFHLAESTPATTLGALRCPPTPSSVVGLRHAECMAAMTLGSPILSPARMQLRRLAVFALWESEEALDAFLANSKLGRKLSEGWHVRLELLRQWGRFSALGDLAPNAHDDDPGRPVVAVTLARLKLPQLLRFIRWGKPVEEQVRDHPGTTLAMAAFRPPRTFSTFSVWRSQREMTDMVFGKGAMPGAERHAAAMIERNRKDFHTSSRRFASARSPNMARGPTEATSCLNSVKRSEVPAASGERSCSFALGMRKVRSSLAISGSETETRG